MIQDLFKEKQRYNFNDDTTLASERKEFQMESGMRTGISPVKHTSIYKKLSKAKKHKLPNPVKIDLQRFKPLDEEVHRLNSQNEM